MDVSRRSFLGGMAAAPFANVCILEGRKGLKWDPAAERFVDPTLNRHLSCEYHNGWKLA